MKLITKLQDIEKLLINKNYKKALKNCIIVLKEEPKNIHALNFSGLSLQGLNEIKESVKYFKKALLEDQNYIPVLNNLAMSYKSLEEIDSARKNYKKIISLNENYIPALNNLALLEYNYSNHNDAFEIFNKLINLNKKDERSLFYLGKIKSEQGNFKEAYSYFKRILALNPKNIVAHKSLAGITTYRENNQDSLKHLRDMEELIKDENLDKQEKVMLCIALGKAFEDTQNYKKSFFFFNEGNTLRKEIYGSYKIADDKDLFKNLELFFLETDFKSIAATDFEKEIIFICGLPRSGTTLTEQILSSHSKVETLGELDYLTRALNKFITKKPLNFNKKLINKLILKNDVQDYYKKRINNHKIKSNILIDKAPLNFQWIGFIKIFFPNAKVIHVSRNAEDNCLSLFKNDFQSKKLNWSSSQKNIANYYNLYFNLIKFWEKKLPKFIYNLKYENVVNNKEYEIQQLLKFCNLEWDDKCINHHKQKNSIIKTSSYSQARKPIYSSSINSNKRYSKDLEEMFSSIKKNNTN